MKKIVGSVFLFGFSLLSPAQYHMGIGLRSGGTSGITIKSNTSSNKAIEGIIGVWSNGISFTGLIEKRQSVFDVSGMFWYYGYGGHVSIYDPKYQGNYFPYWRNKYAPENSAAGFGIDAITGFEYKIPEIPLAVNVEIKPFIEVTTTNNTWFYFDPGIGLRVVF